MSPSAASSQQSPQRRREILVPEGSEPDLRPMKVEDRRRILKTIARGRTVHPIAIDGDAMDRGLLRVVPVGAHAEDARSRRRRRDIHPA